MRFEEAYTRWRGKRLTQEAAARLLGVCERTFRRHIDRFEEPVLCTQEMLTVQGNNCVID